MDDDKGYDYITVGVCPHGRAIVAPRAWHGKRSAPHYPTCVRPTKRCMG